MLALVLLRLLLEQLIQILERWLLARVDLVLFLALLLPAENFETTSLPLNNQLHILKGNHLQLRRAVSNHVREL